MKGEYWAGGKLYGRCCKCRAEYQLLISDGAIYCEKCATNIKVIPIIIIYTDDDGNEREIERSIPDPESIWSYRWNIAELPQAQEWWIKQNYVHYSPAIASRATRLIIHGAYSGAVEFRQGIHGRWEINKTKGD